jgi:hypothetical protein
MPAKSNYISLSGAFLLLTIVSPQAHSAQFTEAMALCDSNPACSHTMPNRAGSVIFKVRRSDETKTILCAWNGRCTFLLPRGQELSIKDISAAFLTK